MLKKSLFIVGVISIFPWGNSVCSQEQAAAQSQLETLSEYLSGSSVDDLLNQELEFYRKDQDGDLLLTSEEKSGDSIGESPFIRFSKFDENQDQQLSLQEYIQLREKAEDEVINDELKTFDLDENKQFSYPEFLESPPGANDLEVRFRRWDTDRDQALNVDEYLTRFHSSKQTDERPGFFYRDRDGDLMLSLKEYAAPPESWNPHLRSRYAILDTDNNGVMSLVEYVAPHQGKPTEEAATRESAHFDFNDDGLLDLEEYALTPQSGLSVNEKFNQLNKDQDESLNLEEYLSSFRKTDHTTERPSFFYRDLNGDLKLSFQEYVAPVEDWQPHLNSRYAILDTNSDSLVSCEEYVAPHLDKPSETAAIREAELFDKNQNGLLELPEYALTPQANLSLTESITRFDQDQDELIHRQEYFEEIPQSLQFEHAIWFLSNDRNLDNRLSFAELENGTRLTDPFEEYVLKLIAEMKSDWFSCDIDQDGNLSKSELNQFQSRQSSALAEFINNHHKTPDANLTWDNTQKILKAAYGLIREDGVSFRFEDGTVINWAFVRTLDENRDHQVSVEEFTKNYFKGNNTEAHFRKFDSNQDGSLGDLELIEQRLFSVNFMHDFCRFDSNFDGELTHKEIDKNVNPSQRPVCKFLVAAFDANSNSKLNLAEFSLTPLANPLLDWYAPQVDLSNDARLDFSEFYSQDSKFFPSLCEWYFKKFDKNADEHLTIDEFPFQIDVTKLPVEVAYEILDQNRDDVFNSNDFNLLSLAGFEEFNITDSRLMHIEDAIQYADTDADGGLSLAEAEMYWSSLRSAFLGQFEIANVKSPSTLPAGENAQIKSKLIKSIFLMLFNILLMSGLLWFVIHRMKDSKL